MIEQSHQETCKCCCGSGVQVLNSGERILCKPCNGSGKMWVSNMANLPPGIYCHWRNDVPQSRPAGVQLVAPNAFTV